MSKKLTTQILTHLLALSIGLGIGYYSWNSTSPSTSATNTTEEAKPNVDTPKGGSDELTTIPEATATEGTTTDGSNSEESNPSIPIVMEAKCGGTDLDMEKFLTSYAESIEAQNIIYKSEPMSDCSGMFIRLMNHLKGECPDYIYPDEKTRYTGALARWFHDNKNLQIMDDVLNYTDLIKPGAVIFYGHQNQKYENPDIEILEGENGVEHIGVVTDITMKDGKLSEYSLYHGRSTGKPASRTYWHKREAKANAPAFGNGSQAIIGIGYATTKKRPEM